ncbi:DUF4350 domain-containing protein [Glaciecola petra]|uniref:DUF4350 domain-containing protein n=1 Tax=Glaciecola petra TaxID=3075602 RepID=A0ABU2ZQ47_9ALTE|nr:DUF4350 domain-containing protein [Aestuariibacter sp. P117]MDT0594753.1 DUF4350 domain-containing protein [Aestuariibacter sp. P117]
MKIEARHFAIAGICLILVVFIIFNLERVEQEIDQGFQKEANEEPFLALQMHMQSYNIDVILSGKAEDLFEDNSLAPLNPHYTDLIIFDTAEIAVSKEISNKLFAWIEQGGHVIVGLDTLEGASTFTGNHFLRQLEVETHDYDRELLDSEFNVSTKINTADFGEINVNVEDSLYITVSDNEELVYSASVLSSAYVDEPIAQDKIHFYDKASIIQVAIGQGLVTLMTDVQIWDNYQIDAEDNAFYIHQLAKEADAIYLMSFSEPLMWYSIIVNFSPAFYWILIFVALINIWFFAVRFGAIKQVEDTVVTYFSQHIKVAGLFYWDTGQKHKLIDDVRSQLLDELRLRMSHPNPSTASMLAALSNISSWPEASLHTLILEPINLNETHFIKLMQDLQALRKMI